MYYLDSTPHTYRGSWVIYTHSRCRRCSFLLETKSNAKVRNKAQLIGLITITDQCLMWLCGYIWYCLINLWRPARGTRVRGCLGGLARLRARTTLSLGRPFSKAHSQQET